LDGSYRYVDEFFGSGYECVTVEEISYKLHNGAVERTIEENNNMLYIQTKGGGYITLGGSNIWLPELIWSDVDNRLIKQYNKTTTKK